MDAGEPASRRHVYLCTYLVFAGHFREFSAQSRGLVLQRQSFPVTFFGGSPGVTTNIENREYQSYFCLEIAG